MKVIGVQCACENLASTIRGIAFTRSMRPCVPNCWSKSAKRRIGHPTPFPLTPLRATFWAMASPSLSARACFPSLSPITRVVQIISGPNPSCIFQKYRVRLLRFSPRHSKEQTSCSVFRTWRRPDNKSAHAMHTFVVVVVVFLCCTMLDKPCFMVSRCMFLRRLIVVQCLLV